MDGLLLAVIIVYFAGCRKTIAFSQWNSEDPGPEILKKPLLKMVRISSNIQVVSSNDVHHFLEQIICPWGQCMAYLHTFPAKKQLLCKLWSFFIPNLTYVCRDLP